MKLKRLTVMVGLPRSGKTTWISKNKTSEVIVSADDLRYVVYGQRFWSDGEPLMWATRGIILKMLMQQGTDIIIDETNTTVERRKDIIKLGKKFGYNIRAVIIDTPTGQCAARAVDKGDDILLPVIDRMAKQFEPVTMDEGFDFIIIPSQGVKIGGSYDE